MRRPWRRGRAREGARRSGGSASNLLSMVVAGAADVLVDQERRLRGGGGGMLSAVLQDRADRAVGAGAEHQRTGAGGIDPFGAIALDQAQDADAGAEALFGMRPRPQNHIDQNGDVAADRFGFAADALVRPVAIAPVRTGHVFGDGGRAVRSQAAAVAGDALAAVENLDCCRSDPRLDLLADQLVRHAVVMLGELDVVIEVDATALPLGVLVGKGWQRHERRLVQRFEERTPAHAPTAHRAVVDLVEQGPDRRVEFGQREEAPVPQPRQNPASDHLHPDLDFGLVPGLVGACRDDRGAVMPGQVGIGPIDRRLVKAALVMPALRLSLTVCRAAPPQYAKARTCTAIQSGSFWLHTASA